MARYRAVMIFLLLITGFISIYIVTQGVSIYDKSKSDVQSESGPAISCTGYIYTVENVKYEDAKLSFTLTNKEYADHEIANITIRSDTGQAKTMQRYLIRGKSAEITASLSVDRNFTVYPDNCGFYAKTCVTSTGLCIGYEPGSYEE